ncbi:MAG: hypothetical protein O2816_04705 [Planctomycetota bacterium]|nr:hypothetical protein [Planctomycetota bacterium]
MHDLPLHYRATVRTLLRFAASMTIVGLLTGVLFQESAKKLAKDLDPAIRWAASRGLALVHGHVFTTTVLIPIAMAAALVLARAIGGKELSASPLRWLIRGYLPCVGAALALMLYKAYHVLLMVRGGEHDLELIDGAYFGGVLALRHALYGVVHVGMAVSLGVFVVALFRSLAEAGRTGA